MADKKTPEELEAALSEALASIDKLKAKNDELIAEKRSTKTGAEARLADAEAKIDELSEALAKSQRESERAVKKAQEEAKAAAETAAQFRERTHKLMKDDGLRKALVEAGVKKEYLDAAHALLRDAIQVDDEKGEVFALDKDGKRLSHADYVKSWAASETGKAFVGVPPSSGGGAQGGGSGGGSGKATVTRSAWDGMDGAARQAHIKAGGVVTD